MHAVVTGMIATYPVGGVAWDYGQYALGLESLGYEVFYLEDTGGQTYNPLRREYVDDCSYSIDFLDSTLRSLSPTLADRWHFRAANGDHWGISCDRLKQIITDADLFLNVSGGTLLRDEYMACRCKVLIDTDPGWNHFVNYPRWDAGAGWKDAHGYRGHDFFFTYAERIGKEDCLLPTLGIQWHPTRPPVTVERWSPINTGRRWTTVMTWNNFRKPVEYQGRTFGTKEMEFPKIEKLPSQCPAATFELATGGSGAPVDRWQQLGWSIRDSHAVSRALDDYRDYIQNSRGELSVAKNLYVATRSGWFSCRSTCYLAAAKPVVVQDTGFSEFLPTGAGLLAFSSQAEAEAAIMAVEDDYERHSTAAREIAIEFFDARRILRDILGRVGLE